MLWTDPVLEGNKICGFYVKRGENDPFYIDLPFDPKITLDTSVLSKFLLKLIHEFLSSNRYEL